MNRQKLTITRKEEKAREPTVDSLVRGIRKVSVGGGTESAGRGKIESYGFHFSQIVLNDIDMLSVQKCLSLHSDACSV